MEEQFKDQKLLIVDDDRVWLNQLSRAMSRRGLIVFEAQSVKEGLEILKKETFDSVSYTHLTLPTTDRV